MVIRRIIQTLKYINKEGIIGAVLDEYSDSTFRIEGRRKVKPPVNGYPKLFGVSPKLFGGWTWGISENSKVIWGLKLGAAPTKKEY